MSIFTERHETDGGIAWTVEHRGLIAIWDEQCADGWVKSLVTPSSHRYYTSSLAETRQMLDMWVRAYGAPSLQTEPR